MIYRNRQVEKLNDEICHDLKMLRITAAGLFVLGFILGALLSEHLF